MIGQRSFTCSPGRETSLWVIYRWMHDALPLIHHVKPRALKHARGAWPRYRHKVRAAEEQCDPEWLV
jgi:hypothetical protein